MDPIKMIESLGNAIPGLFVALFLAGVVVASVFIWKAFKAPRKSALQAEVKALKERAEKAEKERDALFEPVKMVLLPMKPTDRSITMEAHIAAHKASLSDPFEAGRKLSDFIAEEAASLNVLAKASASFGETKRLKGMSYTWHATPEILNRLAEGSQDEKGPVLKLRLTEEKVRSLQEEMQALRDQNTQLVGQVSDKNDIIDSLNQRLDNLVLELAKTTDGKLAIKHAELKGQLKGRSDAATSLETILPLVVRQPDNQKKDNQKKGGQQGNNQQQQGANP